MEVPPALTPICKADAMLCSRAHTRVCMCFKKIKDQLVLQLSACFVYECIMYMCLCVYVYVCMCVCCVLCVSQDKGP